MFLVDIIFFKQLFARTFNIGTDSVTISNNQMIDETFVTTLLNMHETQFISRIKNMGYGINEDTPTSNIIFYICYNTATQLILGQYSNMNSESILPLILEKTKEYEALALKDVNLIVQQIPIGAMSVKIPTQSLLP